MKHLGIDRCPRLSSQLELATVEHVEVPAEGERQSDGLLDEQHRDALLADVPDDLEEAGHHDRRQAEAGLVEHDQRR